MLDLLFGVCACVEQTCEGSTELQETDTSNLRNSDVVYRLPAPVEVVSGGLGLESDSRSQSVDVSEGAALRALMSLGMAMELEAQANRKQAP